MDCLSPEQIVRYLRGNGADPRALEAHVRDCPGCAMELLLAREVLPARRAIVRRRSAWRPRVAIAAAAALIAVLPFLFRKPPAPAPTAVKVPDKVAPAPPPSPPPPPPAPEPRPEPKPEPSSAPGGAPEGKPTPPKPEPKPDVSPEARGAKGEPKPAPAPEPAPTPEPKPPAPKPAPTTVERAIVARVTHAVGSAPGRVVLAGDVVATARQEFLALSLEGYGPVFLRESSRLEIGAAGEIALHAGEMLVRLDAGRRLGLVKTPAADVDIHSPLFALSAAKDQTELSVLAGRGAIGAVVVEGPAALRVKAGKPAEPGALDPGFAAWIPDRLAARKFTGWFEAEAAPAAGFQAREMELASGDRAMVQVEERATLQLKAPLPAKGKHVLWLRARQYPAKAVSLALSVNGQALPEIKLEGQEDKPWRWIGPIQFTSDRADVGVVALSRFPFRGEGERRGFPVAVDLAVVSADPRFVPPDRLDGDRRAYDLVLDEPK
ncbi:MAG TPA: hypothetical protein VF950_07990 [Planctomycetota bacterium]